MKVQFLFFDRCPSHESALYSLEDVLDHLGWDGEIELVRVDTVEQAEEWAFRGSPTFLFDGVDPFADADAPVGLSCRLYTTPDGLSGVPDRDDLLHAVREALGL